MDYYLDQNAYDHLVKAGVSASELSSILRERRSRIILSEHNIQETVSCWKSSQAEKIQFGQALIRLQLELQPVRFLLPTPYLIKYEIAPIIKNTVPGPFLDPESEAQTRAHLLRFPEGGLQKEDLKNMEERWREKEEERNFYEQLRQQEFRGGLKRADNFETFIVQNRKVVKSLAENIVYRHLKEMGERERRKTAKMASSRLSKCPALRTAVRANMFLNHRLILKKKSRHDRWDDLCHSISAAYSDVFVTGDKDLLDCFSLISPQRDVRCLAEFARHLGINFEVMKEFQCRK